MIFRRWIVPSLSLIGAGMVVLIAVLLIKLVSLQSELATFQAGIQEEIEAQNERNLILESNQRRATGDLQEVRRLMNMSPGSYRFIGDGESDRPSPGDETLQTPAYPDALFYAGIDRIEREIELLDLEKRWSEELPRRLEPILQRSPFPLTIVGTGRLSWSVRDGDNITWIEIAVLAEGFQFVALNGDSGRAGGIEEILERVAGSVKEIERSFIEYDDSKVAFLGFLESDRLQRSIGNKQLLLGRREIRPSEILQPIVTAFGGDTALVISMTRLPLEYAVGEARFDEFEPFAQFVLDRINGIDPRTAGKPLLNDRFQRIQEITDTSDFQTYLTQRNLTLNGEPRDTLDFFLFDITNDEGDLLGSFAIQKATGSIYLTDPDEIVIARLENASSDPIQPIGRSLAPSTPSSTDHDLPDEFPPGFRATATDGTNIVLLGIHEEQADSIHLVHLSTEGTISMISIPRDIWWRRRKLNFYHQVYGTKALVREISEMIDQPIDGWISVDMYAFVEIVNTLGGIEVTLQEPLVDPTYRVRENGRWGTLAYDAGTHHLDGIAALRLARSRHTSNDFERADRQQMILEALRERVNELHAGNIDRVYELVETVTRYTESSYSPWELAQFYLRYRNGVIANRAGLSFDNVLYATYSNLYLQGLDRDEVDEDFYLGAWILMPREDEWAVIPWFIEENLR